MITIRSCTSEDLSAVAAIWNAKRLDQLSCWYSVGGVSTNDLESLVVSGFELSIAESNGAIVGFGYWYPQTVPRLIAIAADDEPPYYKLLAAYCDWALSLGATHGEAWIGAAASTERSRMDALSVISYSAIGFEPQAVGDTSPRVPKLLRATCDLNTLKTAVAAALGG